MTKKPILLIMAIGAFASFAVPATASAGPQLFEGGTPLGTSAKVIATSNNFQLTDTAFGDVSCETWQFQLNVTKNNAEGFEIDGGGETATCEANGEAATVTSPSLSLDAFGSDEGTAFPVMIVDVGPFECDYTGIGRLTLTTESDSVNLDVTVVGASEICESEEGGMAYEGDFTLTTAGGTPITIK